MLTAFALGELADQTDADVATIETWIAGMRTLPLDCAPGPDAAARIHDVMVADISPLLLPAHVALLHGQDLPGTLALGALATGHCGVMHGDASGLAQRGHPAWARSSPFAARQNGGCGDGWFWFGFHNHRRDWFCGAAQFLQQSSQFRAALVLQALLAFVRHPFGVVLGFVCSAPQVMGDGESPVRWLFVAKQQPVQGVDGAVRKIRLEEDIGAAQLRSC